MIANETQFREKVSQTKLKDLSPIRVFETNITDEAAGRIWACGVGWEAKT